ncbi:hypothetical protein CYMTET_6537 [Cymbomonas tetramitiformis]|uniref:Uncharacterized protein n=1 Tax=Cymbomonas tetramitiformis TaxID=36881 RepID=A0AAE0GWX4_9CHLO|nr:hypothetical protein CYMTET_6537 [Cymbomonas tetramitiformis]
MGDRAQAVGAFHPEGLLEGRSRILAVADNTFVANQEAVRVGGKACGKRFVAKSVGLGPKALRRPSCSRRVSEAVEGAPFDKATRDGLKHVATKILGRELTPEGTITWWWGSKILGRELTPEGTITWWWGSKILGRPIRSDGRTLLATLPA